MDDVRELGVCLSDSVGLGELGREARRRLDDARGWRWGRKVVGVDIDQVGCVQGVGMCVEVA